MPSLSAHPSFLTPCPRLPTRPRGQRPGRALCEVLEARQLLTVLPTGFAETQLATGFVSPTSMTLAPDGRVFVAEQAGDLRIIKDDALLPTPFLTVSTQAVQERGFGGVVLDPDFNANGYVYVYYTASTPNIHNRISRFTADPASPDRALAGSEQVLFEIETANGAGYHQGGAMHFGPDGKLYVAVGEHGGTTRAQSLAWTFGKMLRLNRDGSIPADNPFYNIASGNQRAIWALGLRNPFTFAIQPGTGRMYINDVGQNLWEEINEGAAAANYGWPSAEGPSSDPQFTAPIYSAPHPDVKAITGGDFYNPVTPQFPAAYTGVYFFADLNKRFIKQFDTTTRVASGFATLTPGSPVDIDTADDGSLYYLARPIDGTRPGGVYRIRYSSTGAPAIAAQPQPRTVAVGQPATFTVVASGAEPLSYQWQRDGGNIAGATGATYTLPATTLADSGATFRAVVTNASGSATSNPVTLTVTSGAAPVPSIIAPADGLLFSAGETISYSGAGTDAEDGALPPSAFTWRVDYLTGEILRPLVAPTTGSTSGTFSIPTLTPYTATDVRYRVTLTVTDSSGLSAETSVDLLPRTARVSLATNVPGLGLAVNGQPVAVPSGFTGVVGFERLLGAAPTQTVNGVTYAFVSWSDGGAAEHAINTPATDTTYVATYQALDDGSTNPSNSPDLKVALMSAVRASVLTGSPGRVRVRVTNGGASPLVGATSMGLYLSADEFLQPDDLMIANVSKSLRLKPGRSKMVPISFTLPDAVAAGAYRLLAWADSGKTVAETDEANNVAVDSTAVTVGPASRDFSATFSDVSVQQRRRVPRGIATLLLRYDGNVPASGPLGVELRASADGTPDGSDAILATFSRRIRMKPGTSRILRVRFLPADLAAGAYYITATVDSGGTFAEVDESNNTTISATTIAVR